MILRMHSTENMAVAMRSTTESAVAQPGSRLYWHESVTVLSRSASATQFITMHTLMNGSNQLWFTSL